MVLLGVENERELLGWSENLSDFRHFTFYEPDFGDEATAIAVIPNDGWIFKRLRLL
jgi:hypothetical protein